MNKNLEFQARLHRVLKDFDLSSAYQLSDEIHQAEAAGLRITYGTELLWLALTDEIQRFDPALHTADCNENIARFGETCGGIKP